MNRRNFLRNVAHSAALVALSACTLRIENPLLRKEPRDVFSVFSHTPAIEPGEYRAGTNWDALRDYCVKDVEMCERLRAAMPRTVMAIDPGYRTAEQQRDLEQIGREKYGRHNYQYHGAVTGRWSGREPNWAPVYAVAGEVKTMSIGQRVEQEYFIEMDLSPAEARVSAYMQAAKPKPLTGKRQDFPLTGKRQNFYGEKT